MTEIKSPCVRNCCLDEDDVCIGCCRTLDEIKSWQALSEQEKRVVLEVCQQRQQQRSHLPTFDQD